MRLVRWQAWVWWARDRAVWARWAASGEEAEGSKVAISAAWGGLEMALRAARAAIWGKMDVVGGVFDAVDVGSGRMIWETGNEVGAVGQCFLIS